MGQAAAWPSGSFEQRIIDLLQKICGKQAKQWNTKKEVISKIKASATPCGKNEIQMIQLIHRIIGPHKKDT